MIKRNMVKVVNVSFLVLGVVTTFICTFVLVCPKTEYTNGDFAVCVWPPFFQNYKGCPNFGLQSSWLMHV